MNDTPRTDGKDKITYFNVSELSDEIDRILLDLSTGRAFQIEGWWIGVGKILLECLNFIERTQYRRIKEKEMEAECERLQNALEKIVATEDEQGLGHLSEEAFYECLLNRCVYTAQKALDAQKEDDR